MFRELSSVPELSNLEQATLKKWQGLDVVNKLKDLRKDSEEKVYYDGPITANNMPHYGHALTWTLKDVVPRYWSMKNYLVSRNMGWDCQGIPVEYEIEKELGFEHKEQIEEYGVAKFNDLCRKSVFKYRDSIFNYENLLGRWFDESDVYYTMDSTYIESMWWSFKELYEKGLLYEGYKVVAYSTRAGTPLSTHEVNDGGYEDLEDPFVTVKFPLKSDPKTFVLAWTTTPWTMPGNLMLGIGKKVDYVKVSSEGEVYILAKARVEAIFGDREHKILEPVLAVDLEGQEYLQPFDYFEHKRSEGVFKIVYFDHVTDEEGTGIVHLAPYGAEDFDKFMELGIQLFDYLDDTAHFTELVPEYKGDFYRDANPKIIEALAAKGLLFASGKYVHKMPMCWRTHTPLIFKPIKSWYIAVTQIKDKMLEQNEIINWVPKHIKDGMSYQWLSGARDWALSRKRYWGTPLPIWVNDKTQEMVVVGSFAELESYSGVKIDDPHRPYVDEVTWEDKANGGTFRRIEDVADVWYDSGSVPFAKLHYPFENKERFMQTFPAEYISEGDDQVRLWFYTMHVLGVALFGQVPYKNVVVTGMLTDKKGVKLSKSKKNFPAMDGVLQNYGADVLRLFLLSSPIVQAERTRFYEEALDEIKKKFFFVLWNSVKYFVTYANNVEFKSDLSTPKTADVLDKWILARFQETVNVVTQNMDDYLIMKAALQLTPFVTDLSTWYIRRSRDRISEGDQEALQTLYYVFYNLAKLLAPMTPFFAEEMYSILDFGSLTKLDSVHFDFYPEEGDVDQALLSKMQTTRDVVSVALAERSQAGLKVRQPLAELKVYGKDLAVFEELVLDEVNVKKVTLHDAEDFKVELDVEITEELRLEGLAREMVRTFQDLRKKAGFVVSDTITATYEDSTDNQLVIDKFSDYIKEKILATELKTGSEFHVEKN